MINLTTCDKEPIHLLGKIQGIGHMVALDVETLQVAFASEGLEASLGLEGNALSHQNLAEILGQDVWDQVRIFASSLQKYQVVRSLIKRAGRHFKAILSKSVGYILIEMEEISDIEKYHEDINHNLNAIDEAIQVFENSKNLSQLLNNAASLLKNYSGFDRVMVYEFDRLGNGKVTAEDKGFGLEPFLGLHYPASDIPQQARSLYLKNKVRAIYDVEDEGKNLQALDGKHAEDRLDMTYSVFRSVSPVHIQYLKNMGVRSTHGISIIVNKKLWGMLLCQEYDAPRFLGINQRLTTQLFGDYLSNRIAILEAEAVNKDLDLLNKSIMAFQYANQKTLSLMLDEQWPNISKLFGCHDYYLSSHIGSSQSNEAISDEQISVLESALSFNKEPIYATKSLGNEGVDDVADFPYAGFIRLAIAQDNGEFLYLFRKEKKKTIDWAGNPEKPAKVDENDPTKLSPRSSFEKWEQTVDGESEDWTEKNIVHAYRLRDSIISYQVESLQKINSYGSDREDVTTNLQNLLQERNKELTRMNMQLRRQLEEQENTQKNLKIAKKAAEQMQKIRSDFPANLSHEIRTPLNGIMGLSLMIQENSATPELKEFAALQIESTKRMTKTLNRVLELAKIQSNGTKPQFDSFSLNEFMANVMAPLKNLAEKKHQKLLVINHQDNVSIVSDQVLLEQIIVNLVTNSIKYTPEKGLVQVNIKIISKNVKEILEITVEDNGIGISEENIENIFEPFFQESEVTKQKDNSSGLGLYLVKKYTEYLNGKVILESEKGEGTMFMLSIPLN